MQNIKIRVHWYQERPDDKDENNGLLFGIYTMDCTKEDYDEEAGYGSYDILDAEWFATEEERDRVLMLEVLEAELVADALRGDTTVLAELLSKISDSLIFASLSDEGQKEFNPILSDVTTIEIKRDEAVEVLADNMSIMIKHNDVGVSVDYYNRETEEVFREDQVWFDDAE